MLPPDIRSSAWLFPIFNLNRAFLRIFPWGGAFFENGPFCEIIY
jgi:hypothetical protein